MLEQVVRRELHDSWDYVGADSDDDDREVIVQDGPIAQHESGAELYVDRVGFGDPSQMVANITQPVQCDGLRAHPVTIVEQFDNKQHLAKFLNDVCNGISDESNAVEAFAFIPHSGTVDSTDISVLDSNTIEDEKIQELVDVFCVYPSSLPDKVGVSDLYEIRKDLIKTVYGYTDELPETANELSSISESYGEARIELYTVPARGLERVD